MSTTDFRKAKRQGGSIREQDRLEMESSMGLFRMT